MRRSTSLLWSIQSPAGKISYLFGTMHVQDDRVYQLCHDLYPLIEKADRYVGEMDLRPAGSPATVLPFDLRDQFKLHSYFKIRKQILKSFKVDIEKYVHLHPLITLSAISQNILETDHAVSLDEHLWNFAKENQVPLMGLESMDEQLEILRSIDPIPLFRQIRDIGSRPASFRKATTKALEYYLDGKIHSLYHLTKSSMRHLRKTLIYERNIRMVDRISKFDPIYTYFITVGAGHLSGRFGLISLLRKNGYTVQSVRKFTFL